VRGDMKLTDFDNLTNFGISDPRMTTIGGVAFRYLDCLPQVSDQVTVEGIQITIMEMDMHRIARVRVARRVSAEEVSEPQADEPEQTEDTDLIATAGAQANEQSEQEAGDRQTAEQGTKSSALKDPANH